MKEKEKIIVLTYSFWPSQEIGARRWTKLAFSLARSGYEVHVIAVKEPSVKKDKLSPPLENGIYIHYLESNHPSDLHVPAGNFREKIKKKFQLLLLKLKTKGTYFDRGVFLRKDVLDSFKKLVTQYRVHNIIAVGAPFSFLRYAAEFKSINKNIRLISDLRDPWTNGHYYGFSSLSEKRKKQEEEYEKMVMINSDYVLCPAPSMTKYLENKYGGFTHREKFKTLFHPFDLSEVSGTKEPQKNNRIVLFSGGTIDLNGIEEIFSPFLKTFHLLREKSPGVFLRTEVVFRSFTVKLVPLLEKEKLPLIHFRNKLAATEFFKEASGASFLMIFLPEDVKDFFITKFTEFLALKKPVILIGAQGDVSDFVEKHRLGFFFDYKDETSPRRLAEAICEMAEGKFEFNRSFDENIFSLDSATRQLISYME
ncbi:MAG: hypothetical protein ACOZCO_03615 [Bacteroidota bacterium]